MGVVVGVVVVCQRHVTSQDALYHRGKNPMRPYEPSQASHGTIGEGAICDHMSPHRLVAAP